MRRLSSRFVLAVGLLGIACSLLAGCPLEAPLIDGGMTPVPGTYYVEERADALYYYQLAETREAEDRWMMLHGGGAWYSNPGFYRLSENYAWTRDRATEGLTLDEFIQLHDPVPEPE